MNKDTAIVIGFFTAPLVSAIFACLMTPGWLNGKSWPLFGLLFLAYLISVVVAILIGWPTFLLLQYFEKITWYSSLMAGALIGALVAIIVALPSYTHVGDICSNATIGATSAFVFWMIWKHGGKGNAQ